jgi:hypothetical protein
MELHQAVLLEVRVAIQILHSEDNSIADEASKVFQSGTNETAALSTRVTDNSVNLLAIQGTNNRI